MTVEPVEWKDLPDQSTPLSAATLNQQQAYVRAQAQAAVAAKTAAQQAAVDATAPTDTTVAALIDTDGTATKGAIGTYVTGEVIPAAVAEIGSGYVRRTSPGPVALSHAALPLPGSPRVGNVAVGDQYVELQPYDTSNAFPALALTRTGRLVAMWRRAASHVRGNKGTLWQATSGDMGATWSTPAEVIAHATMDYRDPMLTTLSDGRLAVTFFQDDGTKAAGVLVAFSGDHGATWGEPVPVDFGRAGFNASSGPMVELADGTLLVCGYGAVDSTTTASGRWDVRVMRSTDGGATWGSSVTIVDGVTDDRPYSETVIGVLPSGDLMALIRCDTATPTIYRSTSTDGGATWSAAAAVLTGASGRPSWTALSSGGVVLTYRRSVGGAAAVATSWDSGVTWAGGDLLGDPPAFQSVYQQPVEISPGLVGVVYADEESAASSRVRFRYLLDGLGITPLGDKRLSVEAAPTTADTVLIPWAGMYAGQLTPASSNTAGGMNRLWSFDPSTANYMSAAAGPLPSDWATFDIRLVWSPQATTAGNVRWDVTTLFITDGVTPSNGSAGAGATAAAGGTTTVRRTTVATGIARVAAPLHLRIARTAADAADTFASGASLFGIELVRAS